MCSNIPYLLVYNEHGYLGAVFAGVEDLMSLIERAVKPFHLDLSKHLRNCPWCI